MIFIMTSPSTRFNRCPMVPSQLRLDLDLSTSPAVANRVSHPREWWDWQDKWDGKKRVETKSHGMMYWCTVELMIYRWFTNTIGGWTETQIFPDKKRRKNNPWDVNDWNTTGQSFVDGKKTILCWIWSSVLWRHVALKYNGHVSLGALFFYIVWRILFCTFADVPSRTKKQHAHHRNWDFSTDWMAKT